MGGQDLKNASKRAKTSTSKQSEVDSDLPTPRSQANQPSSTAWSTRALPLDRVLPLTTTCLRVFAQNLKHLSSDLQVWEIVKMWLKELPEALIPRLFGVLRETCPELLSHGFIVAYLLRGASITLTSDLPGVNKHTIRAIGEASCRKELRELELSGLDKLTDAMIASVVSKLPSLQVLVLRGCSKVGPKTTEAIAKHCSFLVKLNLNYTAASPASLAPLLLSCPKLEVLKVAGIPNWTDAAAAKLLSALPLTENPGFQLPNLINLNLRQTSFTDMVVNRVLSICPNVRRLDLSFTAIRRPPLLPNMSALQKLSVTSTQVSGPDLIQIISNLPDLRCLSIGAIGGGQGMSVALSNTSAMTLTDQTLRGIADRLAVCSKIENVSLVGNTKLGVVGRRDRALAYFVRKVGRKCRKLNMAGIPGLRSSDLEPLLQDEPEEDVPPLQELVLNNTGVNDNIATFIASCPALQTLELAGTKVTEDGLFHIIDACTCLQNLNLTSCRGIGVVDRRRFFEVWERDRKDD